VATGDPPSVSQDDLREHMQQLREQSCTYSITSSARASKCEHWRSIDLADLKRMGLLKPIVGGRIRAITWKNDHVVGSTSWASSRALEVSGSSNAMCSLNRLSRDAAKTSARPTSSPARVQFCFGFDIGLPSAIRPSAYSNGDVLHRDLLLPLAAMTVQSLHQQSHAPKVSQIDTAPMLAFASSAEVRRPARD